MIHRPLALATVLSWLLLGQACKPNMDEQSSYQPQEAPRLSSPPGSIPRDSRTILSPRTAVDTRRGQRLFAVNCAHCHGVSGTGDGPVAGHLTELPKNLRSNHVQDQPDEALFRIMTDGRDAMPAFGGLLSVGERRAIVAYLRTLTKPGTHQQS
jgi:mono/diheme cytochrome c family protein